MWRRGLQGLALPGVGGRYQLYLVQPEELPGGVGQRDMRDVHRVEAAAEQADACHTHSRGRRNSARAASGVPACGCQS
ncbi:Uncharacterised protein [Bordetella pertussis]|nr:Uncharacterised protein [Bordetella pertussis]